MCLSFAIERERKFNLICVQRMQNQQKKKQHQAVAVASSSSPKRRVNYGRDDDVCVDDKRRMHFMLTLNIRFAETVIGV